MAEASVSKTTVWISYVLSVLPCLLLFLSASFKFMQPAGFDEGIAHLGWDGKLIAYIGVLEITVAVLYLIPKTSVFGAILIAAYMGGAVATHVRVGDPFWVQILIIASVWGGLYLRDPRIRQLIPFRS